MAGNCCSGGCCGSGREPAEKRFCIKYLYLDLNTCERCMGTDLVLDEVVEALRPALTLAGYRVEYEKKEMSTAALAEEYHFVSSPTNRVNGRDICPEVEESDCGCCGRISGTQVDCRVFSYEGNLYEVPPKAMLAEAILKYAFASPPQPSGEAYQLPPNLEEFFAGKEKKSSCGCCSCC